MNSFLVIIAGLKMPEASIISKILNSDVKHIERIGDGRNSRIYKVVCENFKQYAAKFYFHHSSDDRDRLSVEYSSLEFLWERGIRCIAKPVMVDREHSYAVYEYIEGDKISSKEVNRSDVDCCIEFLCSLKKLRNTSDSMELPTASEACLSIRAIIDNIYHRLDRLQVLQSEDELHRELNDFLRTEFSLSLRENIASCTTGLQELGISFEDELQLEERTLSPSDFGFHNAVKRKNGEIVFLDFEYFGWDDPAKTISDFLLHPAMELGNDLKNRFLIGMLECFNENHKLGRRVEILYPFFKLKWCLILLNEFVPQDLCRRNFASDSALNKREAQNEQLKKAKLMIKRELI